MAAAGEEVEKRVEKVVTITIEEGDSQESLDEVSYFILGPISIN